MIRPILGEAALFALSLENTHHSSFYIFIKIFTAIYGKDVYTMNTTILYHLT